MADPAKIAEPRVLVAILILVFALGVALTLIVGSPQYSGDRPVILSAEGAPSQAEAQAASSACRAAASDPACMIWVLERTRERAKMPALAREYSRLPAR